ncbi:MAG: Do family serine endopeptidase [Thermodesulfobacteriota bacterium]
MHRKRSFAQLAVALILAGSILAVGAGGALSAPDEDQSMMLPANITELAEKAKPAVVNIRTVKNRGDESRVFRHFFGDQDNPLRDFFGPFRDREPGRQFKQQSLGSGFVIDNDGYIVTNNHVVEGADEIKVRLPGDKEYDAEVVGRDPKTDLALIRVDSTQGLEPLTMGNSETLKVGEWVVAIGSPFGLEQTVTTGIVSAKGRVIGAGPYDDFIQTDASINPGNSGGPLLNLKGEVVGINSAIIASGQGIGFAIPISMAKGIIAQLKTEGAVTRAWLGVGIQDLTSEIKDYYGIQEKDGVLITQVFEGDPADEAGIREGDVVISVNDIPGDSSRDLSAVIANLPVGEKASVRVLRDDDEKTYRVKLTKRTDEERIAQGDKTEKDELGLGLSTLEPETARRLGYDRNAKGVLVTLVQPGSKADRAGIRQGDLIMEVNHNPVETVKKFREEMDDIDSGESVRFLMRRGNAGLLVATMTK